MVKSFSNNRTLIGEIAISYQDIPKIIAEIGINHNGSLSEAKRIAEAAINSGAHIIKTQFHLPEEEMSLEAKSTIPSHCSTSIFSIIEDASLSPDDEFCLKEFIESSGCAYLSTPFSVKAADILGGQFHVNAFKIGSGECNNYHILKACASYGVPLIVSTGMTTLDSCKSTYDYLRELSVQDILMLHTTNIYPTPHNLVRLGGIAELQDIAGINSVGLSDHTTSNLACLGAIALGAVIVERHFTDDKSKVGPDIENSMDPQELKQLVEDSRLMYLMRGGSKAHLVQEEDDTRAFAIATLVSTRRFEAGHVISLEDFVPKRPASGDFLSKDIHSIIGRKLRVAITEGMHLLDSHLD